MRSFEYNAFLFLLEYKAWFGTWTSTEVFFNPIMIFTSTWVLNVNIFDKYDLI